MKPVLLCFFATSQPYSNKNTPTWLSVPPPCQRGAFHAAKTRCCLAKGLCNTMGLACCEAIWGLLSPEIWVILSATSAESDLGTRARKNPARNNNPYCAWNLGSSIFCLVGKMHLESNIFDQKKENQTCTLCWGWIWGKHEAHPYAEPVARTCVWRSRCRVRYLWDCSCLTPLAAAQLLLLHETTLGGSDGSQKLLWPLLSKPLAAKPSEVGPFLMLEECNDLLWSTCLWFLTEAQNQNSKFAAQFPHRHHKCQ